MNEIMPLLFTQWPFVAAYGDAIMTRSTDVRLPRAGSLATDGSGWDLTALLRRDLLSVSVVRPPSLRLPVQSLRDDGPDDGRIREVDAPDGPHLTLRLPSVLIDTTSVEIAAADLLRPTRGPADEPGYLDACEWWTARIERDHPGRLDAALRELAGTPGGRSDCAYEEVPAEASLTADCLALCRALGRSPEEILLAAALLVTNRRWDGTPVLRRCTARPLPALRTVMGRLEMLLPVTVTSCGPDLGTLLDRLDSASEQTTHLLTADTLAAVRPAVDLVSRRRPGAPLVGVVPQARCASGEAGGVRIHGDDPGPCDVLLRPWADGSVTVRYDRAADPDRVRWFTQRLTRALRALAEHPGRPLPELELIGDDERARLTGYGDRRGEPAGTPPGLLRAVASHRLRRDGGVAVHGADGPVGYDALLERAGELALRLRPLLAGPEPVVALVSAGLTGFCVGALAIMDSGAAYLPIDPAWPAARTTEVLRAAGVRVLVRDPAAPDPEVPDGVTVVPSAPAAGDGAVTPDRHRPVADADPASLAYVMATSGSTGRPRLVAVEHAQLAAYCRAVTSELGLDGRSVLASPASVAADLGYTAVLAGLWAGGTVVEVPTAARLDGKAFARVVAGHGVSMLKITPSHLRALLTTPHGRDCLPSRLLVLGGEALPPDLVSQVRQLAPGLTIVNHYGPTETTVGVVAGRVVETTPDDVALGRPLPGVAVEVRDPLGLLCSVGQPGELFVTGSTVSRGYHRAPAETADRFRPSTSGPPGRRVYATGDRCAWDDQGRLHFLGRTDDQVKVRGYRVEPAETERVLTGHPGVHAAAAVALTGSGGPVLGACVVTGRPRPTEHELLVHLRDRLPEAAVPARILDVAALPLLGNGKVDRARIRRLFDETPAQDRPAADDLEYVLAWMWAGLLGVPAVPIEADLFNAGAHSLTVTSAMSRLSELLDVEVPLPSMFEHRTVASFAAYLGHREDAERIRERAAVARTVLSMSDTEVAELTAGGMTS
ncbi:non-ribosomal peptide synthetase [Dactylosporangium roseum]|uniref:Non-ribosomal peptide synthetase n=1 Tax=Dactylosporangium roseum TaxID=47989 RepID=A0ABY5ZCV2_9ACTN|nr:non-ribosomal peptide synthetase [Dactylosporangium roseum]UWZ39406.1 non-ribosomal peptide synthetase [Dactylosporangium roseum]